MVRAEYTYWYGKAEKSADVERIVKHFRLEHEAVRESREYARRECGAKGRLACQFSGAGLDSGAVEEIMVRYSEVFQDIYFELGLKVGARLGAEYLTEKESGLSEKKTGMRKGDYHEAGGKRMVPGEIL